MSAPLMLSISGLRGLVGQSLTPAVAARYAAAFGQWLKAQPVAGGQAPCVVVGRDSRPSGQMIDLAACSGLIAAGCRVVGLGIATTPGVAIMAEHRHATGGMVITASHNPILWNGIKALRHDGVAPAPAQAQQIINTFHTDAIAYAPVESLLPLEHDDATASVHVARVLACVDVALIRRSKIKVVVDSVHGAGGPSAAMLLDELGVERVHLYAQPTGLFPHPPEPTRENLRGLGQAVVEHGAALGFAQDPDADRLAIVDEAGRYIGEEYTLALAVKHVLAQSDAMRGRAGIARDMPENTDETRPGKLPGKPPGARSIAANLSTSRMIDDIAQAHGVRVLRTPVGEANVVAAMREHHCILGGEGNGGVIDPRVVHVRDSLIGMALVLEMLAQQALPLSAVVDEIPHYAIVKDKADVQPAVLATMEAKLRDRFGQATMDTRDGIRIDWADQWVHVRPSNTEPIIRIIAEAPQEAAANERIQQVRTCLGL